MAKLDEVKNMKQTLLNTGIFIDNKYLDSYVKLISKQHKIKGYAEWHHIIPVSYYAKLHNLQLGKSGRHKAEVIADADINNKKVLLSYADHCKAHWLLSKCLVAEYAKSSASAFLKMLNVVRDDLTIVRYKAVIFSGLTKQEYKSLQNKISEIKELNPRYWKKEDLDFLAENYKKYSLDELAKKLGRTKNSLRSIAQIKGIDKRRIFWTDERIEQLRHLYLDLDKSALECAKILGVAEATVIKQCRICGFRKAKSWTEEEDKFIIENDSKYTVEELAKILKVSKTTLMGRRWTLGLTKWDRTKK